MGTFLQLAAFVLPWALRRRVLALMGFELAPGAKVGFSIVKARRVVLAEGASIGHLSHVSDLDAVVLGVEAKIGNLNWISGRMTRGRRGPGREAILSVGDHSSITNRHYIDCNAGITIGRFSTFAGVRSQVLTHSINFRDGRQEFADVSVGDYAFVGSGVILLPGAVVPSRCIISAGSVVRPRMTAVEGGPAVYTGNPAVFEKHLPEGSAYFSRTNGVVG